MKKLVLMILFSTLMHAGCQNSHDRKYQEKVITIATLNDPQGVDPRLVRDLSTVTVLHMLYEGLMRKDQLGQIIPGIAEKVKVSKNLKTYTFKLRDSHWSNGDAITAEDFVDTWKSILDPSFPAPNAYQLYPIQGAKEAKEGSLSLDKVGIYAKNPKTLVVELSAPTPYFLELVSSHFYFPVSKTMREGKKKKSVVVNGPFKLHNWRHQDEFVAVKNSEYWNKNQINVDKIIVLVVDENTSLQMYENRELDWVGSPMSTLPQDAVGPLKESGKLYMNRAAGTHWFRFNTNKAPLNHAKIRRALNLAINRKDLVEHITQGNQIPAFGIIPPCLTGDDCIELEDSDLSSAQKLFQEALWEMKMTREKLDPIRISYSYNDRNHKIAQAVQQQWTRAFDIEVELNSVEGKVFFDQLSKKEYQAALGSWYADIRDPINFLEVFKYKTNSTNNTEWENSRYIALLDFSSLQTDPEKRKEILKKAEEFIILDVPVAPLFHGMFNYLKSDRVKNVYFSDLGYLDFRYAHVN